jgi:hypothetical protein
MNPLPSAIALAMHLLAQPSSIPVDLPVYTYAIRSGHYLEGGLLMQSINEPVPGTMWRCSISYIASGVMAKCALPGGDSSRGGEGDVRRPEAGLSDHQLVQPGWRMGVADHRVPASRERR